MQDSKPASNIDPHHSSALQSIAEQLARLNATLSAAYPGLPPTDWSALAWRWRPVGERAYLQALPYPHAIRFEDLRNIDEQKAQIMANTAQFVAGRPANHVLLTGARGTGKSSLIKASLQAFSAQGLRMIEVDKEHLLQLPDIVELIAPRPEKFIIYCDDLSFEAHEVGYKALKSVLDGSLSAASSNVLIYASSNRRHLLPEIMRENLSYQHSADGELHPGEASEEKISLSERFGLWLSFYSFSQDEYLEAAAHWLQVLGDGLPMSAEARAEALRWALQRGSRSGRVARQFAQDWVGRQAA